MDTTAEIFVVDDEVKISSLLERLLEAEGYTVESFRDGGAALREVAARRPSLLITDLMMPGMDGLDLLRRARAIDPDLPVVMITGYASMETAVAALREGVDDYITKPFSLDELKSVVGRILENRNLAAENRRLVEDLRVANAELEQHRQRLAIKVAEAESDLVRANLALKRRLEEMEVIHEINRMTATVFDEERLLTLVTRLILDKVGADAVAVLMADDEREHLVVRGVRGVEGRRKAGARTGAGEGALGHTFLTGEALLIPDVGEDLRPTAFETELFGTGSLLSTPISFKGRPAGVLALGRGRDGDPIRNSELRLISVLANDLSIALENARLFDENERTYIEILAALVESMEARDPYLRHHSERVRMKAIGLGKELSLPPEEIDLLGTGARLHDLGKVGIEDRILHKPDSLDDGEMETMRSHPEIGDRIVKPLGKLSRVKCIIRHHHEHWNGRGYPDGLSEEGIPFLAQIVSIADSFDAMTSNRSYRKAMPRKRALEILSENAGEQFNPFLVEVYTDMEMDRLRRHGKLEDNGGSR